MSFALWLVEIYLLSQDQFEKLLSLGSFTSSQPSLVNPVSVTLCILFKTGLPTEGFLKSINHKKSINMLWAEEIQSNITLNVMFSLSHSA